jgi:hypothetical protein
MSRAISLHPDDECGSDESSRKDMDDGSVIYIESFESCELALCVVPSS